MRDPGRGILVGHHHHGAGGHRESASGHAGTVEVGSGHGGARNLEHQRRFPESAGTRQDRHFAHRQNGVNVGRIGPRRSVPPYHRSGLRGVRIVGGAYHHRGRGAAGYVLGASGKVLTERGRPSRRATPPRAVQTDQREPNPEALRHYPVLTGHDLILAGYPRVADTFAERRDQRRRSDHYRSRTGQTGRRTSETRRTGSAPRSTRLPLSQPQEAAWLSTTATLDGWPPEPDGCPAPAELDIVR